MPGLQGLLRRRGQPSDADLNRRHTLFLADPPRDLVDIVEGRNSEQLSRLDRQSNILEPQVAQTNASADIPAPLSPEVTRNDNLLSPVIPEEDVKKQTRFSMLRFRHASDSQLSTTKARQQAQQVQQQQQQQTESDASLTAATPPVPRPPQIITTAPTIDLNASQRKRSKLKLPTMTKASPFEEMIAASKRERRKTMSGEGPSGSRITFDEPSRLSTHIPGSAPPAYGDEAASTLALPINRLSESSRSDGSDHVYGQTTTTVHTTRTTTTFFRLPRRRTQGPLFPLPPKGPFDEEGNSLQIPTKYNSMDSRRSHDSAALQALRMCQNEDGSVSPGPASSQSAMAKAALMFAAPGSPMVRRDSTASRGSNSSSPRRLRLGLRGRSSTVTSLRNVQTEDALETPPLPSSRTSTSTGRKSFGDLFGLSARMRAESNSGAISPGGFIGGKNSLTVVPEPLIIPERYSDDTPAKYLLRLEEAVSRGVVASVLSKGTDTFSQQVLRSYMRGFGFFGDPLDMAIRKLLMEVELPKETQQIDRCLQAFADRYHECNPGIYASSEQAYFIAFSLLILHTDVFNKNNKHKMQKAEYVRNTQGEGVFDEILHCFYDNVSYTPFIHVEDDLDINGERIVQTKSKKKTLFPRSSMDPTKRHALKEPIDPYTLIIDSKLDSLRPNLKDVMETEEHYSYLAPGQSLNMEDLQKTFFRTGVLQIISARSRPDAFMSDKTVLNPDEAHPGIVDIKITKVGLLWRKDTKRKKTQKPWQEWGAILTGAQLYFFRNTTWIKSLMHQHKEHIKKGNDGVPVTFKPPLESFKPDALMSTDDAVALVDSTYKKHKNAFIFVRHGGFEETFLANDEEEMNDWLAKLNYAAAFRTAGVRMRGVVGGNYEGQRTRGIRRLDSSASGSSVQTPTGEVHIVSGKIDQQMAQDILAARREIMQQKILQAEARIAEVTKQLEIMLRNARHLCILAPIQAKTREAVIMSAGKMAAKLRWVRMEVWRLRCHRDILRLDLEEENKIIGKRAESAVPAGQPALENTPSKATDRDSLIRMDTKGTSKSTVPSHAPQTPPLRPATMQSSPSKNDFGMDDIFATPPTQASTFSRQQAAWELPPLKFGGLERTTSPSSNTSRQPGALSPVLSHMSSYPSMRREMSPDGHRTVSTPHATHNHNMRSPDAGEQVALCEAGLIDHVASHSQLHPRMQQRRASETVIDDSKEAKDEFGDELKVDRANKIRRSIHRTLRETPAHIGSHLGSQKKKEKEKDGAGDKPVKDGEEPEKSTSDHLSRGSGSFVVHGKKASVITFGDELSGLAQEERLKGMRNNSKLNEVTNANTPANTNTSMAYPPLTTITSHDIPSRFDVRDREHRESAASNMTATGRSFKELHQRLREHSGAHGDGSADAVDLDSEVGDSSGVRTPPARDSERPGTSYRDGDGGHAQAAFYSPEAPATPRSRGSKMSRSERAGEGDEGGRLEAEWANTTEEAEEKQ